MGCVQRKRRLHRPVHCSTIQSRQNPEARTGEWIKKLWYILTVEYDTAVGKKEGVEFAHNQRDMERVLLSEMSEKERDRHRTIAHS